MHGHLLTAGFSTTVTTRTPERAKGLLELRDTCWADSPRAVAQASDVVFSIVGHPADVRSSDARISRGALGRLEKGKRARRYDHERAHAG